MTPSASTAGLKATCLHVYRYTGHGGGDDDDNDGCNDDDGYDTRS